MHRSDMFYSSAQQNLAWTSIRASPSKALQQLLLYEHQYVQVNINEVSISDGRGGFVRQV